MGAVSMRYFVTAMMVLLVLQAALFAPRAEPLPQPGAR